MLARPLPHYTVLLLALSSMHSIFPIHLFFALQVNDRRMILFVHLPGSISSEVIDIKDRDTHVFHIKKAVVEAFKRFKDFDASELQLFKLDGGNRILLNSSQTLSEAGVQAGTTLVVELAAAQVFASPAGACVICCGWRAYCTSLAGLAFLLYLCC